MLKKLRKSSGRVTLLLLGVSLIAGCGQGEARRDVYASREDCLADWGHKPEDCTPATDRRHASGGYFYGPSYYAGTGARPSGSTWTSGSRSGSRSIGSTSSPSRSSSGVSRGGFGSSGRSSAS